MPINKQIRSFSPYSYNIQYAKAGKGPFQKAKPYVKTAVSNPEHFVVSKAAPDFYAYAVNSFRFTLNDECMLKFDMLLTTITVVDKEMHLAEGRGTFGEMPRDCPMAVTDLNGPGVVWRSERECEASNNLGELADCFVLGDGEYLKIQKKFDGWKTLVRFQEGFSRGRFSSLKMVVYSLSPDTSYFITRDAEVADFQYDRVNKLVHFSNPFCSNKAVAMVLGLDGFTVAAGGADLTPSRITLRNDGGELAYDKAELQARYLELSALVASIRSANFGMPWQALYEQNEEFRRAVDEKDECERKIAMIGDDRDVFIAVTGARVYSYETQGREFRATLRQGVDASGVKWDGASVIVTHGLGAHVNIIVDSGLMHTPAFKAYMLSENAVKLEFTKPEHVICDVRIFAVGA